MDPAIIGSLIGLGSTGLSLGGNFLTNSLFRNKDFETSKDLACYNYKLQRQFTRDYHSLNTESLRDAGLNPLLSATGGSSGTFNPGGGFGRSSVSGVKVPDGGDFLDLMKGSKELDILNETKKKIKAETDSIKESTRSTKLFNDHKTKYPSSEDHPYNRLFNNLEDLGDTILTPIFDLFTGNGAPIPASGEWKLDELPKFKFINLPNWDRIMKAPYKLWNKFKKK